MLLSYPRICFWSLLAAVGKTHITVICCRFSFTLSWIFHPEGERRRFSCFQSQLYSCNPNLFCPCDDKKPLKGFHLRSPYKLHFLQVLLKSMTVIPYISILFSCHCPLHLTVVLFLIISALPHINPDFIYVDFSLNILKVACLPLFVFIPQSCLTRIMIIMFTFTRLCNLFWPRKH